jgi:hypothetical protein
VSDELVAAMEDVLDWCAKPYDPQRLPLITGSMEGNLLRDSFSQDMISSLANILARFGNLSLTLTDAAKSKGNLRPHHAFFHRFVC